jgi:hypothetical protein
MEKEIETERQREGGEKRQRERDKRFERKIG